jgi:hypothetical protein
LEKLVNLFKSHIGYLPVNISKLFLIQAEWGKIVCGFLSRLSIPLKVGDKKLLIGVLDNIVMQELSYKKDEIIEKLKEIGIDVTSLQFKIVNNNLFTSNDEVDSNMIHIDMSKYEYISKNIHNVELRNSFIKAFEGYIKYLKVNNIDI